MLRYNKTRPGLVALYEIQPGNGVGLFLQPRSPHGANNITKYTCHKPLIHGSRSTDGSFKSHWNTGIATRFNLTQCRSDGEQFCIALCLEADIQYHSASIMQPQHNSSWLSRPSTELQTLQASIPTYTILPLVSITGLLAPYWQSTPAEACTPKVVRVLWHC